MSSMPRVSVVMSVYNGACYLREAIDSILSQTFQDYEFIIVDDGCTDESPEILSTYTDARIVQLRNETNVGLIRSLNRGISAARGEYIARMDANDVALPQRLARQVGLMRSDPALGLVSSWFEVLYEDRLSAVVQLPCTDSEIQDAMMYKSCICHPASLFRRDLWAEVGGYRVGYEHAEDRDLWHRMAERSRLANVPEVLLKYRVLASGISVMRRREQRRASRRIVEEAMQRRQAGVGPRVSNLATARHHLFLALEYLAEGNLSRPRKEMDRAMAAYPQFSLDREHIAKTVVERALEVTQGPGDPMEWGSGLALVNQFFDSLPGTAGSLTQLRRETFGLYHVACAFRAHRLGYERSTLSHALRGIASNPRWLSNRGVLSILGRALRPYVTGWPPNSTHRPC